MLTSFGSANSFPKSAYLPIHPIKIKNTKIRNLMLHSEKSSNSAITGIEENPLGKSYRSGKA
jgi:hypothetical protein